MTHGVYDSIGITMIFLESDFGISEWVNNLLYKKLHTGSGGYRYFQDDSRKCPYHITVAVHGLNMLYKKSNPKINSFITIPQVEFLASWDSLAHLMNAIKFRIS